MMIRGTQEAAPNERVGGQERAEGAARDRHRVVEAQHVTHVPVRAAVAQGP